MPDEGYDMRIALASMLLLVSLTAQAANSTTGMPAAQDFAADARVARAEKKPIMVFFAADFCGYCEQVSDLYLRPMLKHEGLADKVLFRVVEVDSAGNSLRGFAGEDLDHRSFASRESASFTPIIKFYDPDGKELVPELMGYFSPDFYGQYLERAIDIAVTKMRNNRLVNAR